MSSDLAHLSSDEDTEEENNNNREEEGAPSPSKDAEGKALAKDELLRTKRPRSNKPFNEDLLMSDEGLSRIYREFPLACQFQARGSEAAFLQRVINFYKDWAFQLHPGLSFSDVVMKCESLGSKGRIRGYLQSMREKEKERYVEEVLLPRAREREANDIAIQNSRSPDKKQKKRKRKSHQSTSPEEEFEEREHLSGENSENDITNDKHEKDNGRTNIGDDPFGTDDDEPVESDKVVDEEVHKDEKEDGDADKNADQEENQEDPTNNDKDDKESIFGDEEQLLGKTAEGGEEHVSADDVDGVESFEETTQRQ